jgi:hypothetical protein
MSHPKAIFGAVLPLLVIIAIWNYRCFLSAPDVEGHRVGTEGEWLTSQRRSKWIKNLWTVVPFVYIAAVIWAALFILPGSSHVHLRACFAIALVLGPPLYFFMETVWIYGNGHGKDEDYKATQDLASKIWLAVSGLLYLYWFNKAG